MKASELKKESLKIESVYEDIEKHVENNPHHCKWFIPHFVYISESVKDQLMRDGFDLTIGDWDNNVKNCLIIKW